MILPKNEQTNLFFVFAVRVCTARKFFCSFFGRIYSKPIGFRFYLTFSYCAKSSPSKDLEILLPHYPPPQIFRPSCGPYLPSFLEVNLLTDFENCPHFKSYILTQLPFEKYFFSIEAKRHLLAGLSFPTFFLKFLQ